MKNKLFNYLCILLGGIAIFVADTAKKNDVYILSIGILLLMLGLYRLSRGISDNKPKDNFVKTEEIEDEEIQ
jgi:sulfite exporter TauE/SafE